MQSRSSISILCRSSGSFSGTSRLLLNCLKELFDRQSLDLLLVSLPLLLITDRAQTVHLGHTAIENTKVMEDKPNSGSAAAECCDDFRAELGGGDSPTQL